ncbi:MAG: hypothetical protein ACKO5K_02120 [Armatimonadota bacterium]
MVSGMQNGRTVRAMALAGLSVAATVLAGCSGGANRFDPNVPVSRTRDIAGDWRVTNLSINGRSVSCQDPENIFGDPITNLTDKNVVVASCGPTDTYTFGPANTAGEGAFEIREGNNVGAGTYTVSTDQVVLVRTSANGTALSAPLQRVVFAIKDTTTGIQLVPVAQKTAYRKLREDEDAFNEDGTLRASNVTPVLNDDAIRSINTIVLPNTDVHPIVHPDLTITVGLPSSASVATDTPGFVKRYGVTVTLKKATN